MVYLWILELIFYKHHLIYKKNNIVRMSSLERDPKKRRVKPLDNQASILDFELGESSDDSDFRIEDHPDLTDDDDSINTDGDGNDKSSGGSSEDSEDDSDINSYKKINLPSTDLSIAAVIEQAEQNAQFGDATSEEQRLQRELAAAQVQICCGCLGDQSDGSNEIVECDACGATVHEACYGCSDSASLSSSDSVSPTAPWFCDTCKAGVRGTVCELCPNTGGIFKETDVGRWVHLVCALYVPGVAFGEVDRLSGVTLFEMPYSRWGAKACCLCTDQRLARTGVCIGCDAGMCRTYFHVTCAQREGFLSEAHSEEVDQADPFYAHCRLHSDKTLVRRRRRNYLALELRTQLRQVQFARAGHADSEEQVRIQRKLKKERLRYLGSKKLKPTPWVPTQKMPRLLTTSATACRRLLNKAQLMGVDSAVQEMHEAHTLALADIRKKWHIAPAFTVEFIAYYLDRNERMREMKELLEALLKANKTLVEEQSGLSNKYDILLNENSEHQRSSNQLRHLINLFHSTITAVCPTKRLALFDDFDNKSNVMSNVTSSNGIVGVKSTAGAVINAVRTMPQQMMVPTAAALKMGVGFPLGRREGGGKDGTGRVLSSHARSQVPSGQLNTGTTVTASNANSNPSANSLPISLLVNERCGICRQPRDQHLMAKCDTCHLHYHLGCLQPPLTRPPKKSKLYGWQCSECDKTSGEEDDDDDDDEIDGRIVVGDANQVVRKKVVRRSRTRFSKGEDGGTRELIVDDKDPEQINNPTEIVTSIKVEESPVPLSIDANKREKSPKPRSSKERRKSEHQDKFPTFDLTEARAEPLLKSSENATILLPRDLISAKTSGRKTRLSSINQMETVPVTEPSQQAEQPQSIQQNSEINRHYSFNNLDSDKEKVEISEIVIAVDKKVGKKAKGKCKKAATSFVPEDVPIEKRIKIVKIKPLEPKSDDVELATPTVTLQLRQYNDIPSPPQMSSASTSPTFQFPNKPVTLISGTLNPTTATNSSVMNNMNNTTFATTSMTIPTASADFSKMGNGIAGQQQMYVASSKPKKRRREKHRNRYSPDGDNSVLIEKHKRKRKKKSLDIERPSTSSGSNSTSQQLSHPRITIKIKSIPLPAGEVASVSNPQCFYVNNESSNEEQPYPAVHPIAISCVGKPALQCIVASTNTASIVLAEATNSVEQAPVISRKFSSSVMLGGGSLSNVTPTTVSLCCYVCKVSGPTSNFVKCDECQKNYHFTCLDPPLKKTPKKRGYSWHCADCDPTVYL